MKLVRLFHVSEEPDIRLFEPRPAPLPDAGVTGDAVWAIDEEHLPNYLLPRDCPRVTYAAGPDTTAEDIAGFFGGRDAKRVVVVEQGWKQRIADCVLHVYEMPADSFRLTDVHAGYYISRDAVAPLRAHAVRDCLSEIAGRDCEVRLVPDLQPIRDIVANSSLSFSIIRMRNARRTR